MFYKVIMVDDENFALDNVAMHFNWESMGFNLSGKFNDAQSALTYLQNNQVDIVITDIRMPKMSGIELAEVIQRQYSHIVVVFLSAYSEFEYARSALHFNVADYLVKPITLESLSDLCRTIYKKLAGKDAHSLVHQEAIPFQLQKALSNYFTNQSTDISELMKAVEESGEASELIGLPSTILSLHIEDLDEYLLHTWRQGKESFYQAINSLVTHKDIMFTTISQQFDGFEILAISKKADLRGFSDQMTEFYRKLEDSCQAILNVTIMVGKEQIFPDLITLSKGKNLRAAIRAEMNLLRKYMTDRAIDSIELLLTSFIDNNKNNAVYLQLLAYELHKLLCQSISYDQMKEYGIVPKQVNLPLTFDSLGMPCQINILVSYLSDTVKNIIRFYQVHPSSGHDIISKAKSYICENYMKNITLSDIAEYTHYNPAYLCRIFKKETGMNFIDYMNDVRIGESIDMLINTDSNVSEISNRVGYLSVCYFYRKFKAKTGLTAQEYRKKYRN